MNEKARQAAITAVYDKLHENKLGAHWLWCVIEKIVAGESEEDAMREYGYYARAALAAQPGAVPADCDVRKIMLDVVPGWDGEGVEVYAKSVAEVEAKLGEIWAELEEWQMGIRKLAAAPTEAKPAQDAVDAEWLSNLIRSVDGNNTMGAGALAEKIVAAISAKKGGAA